MGKGQMRQELSCAEGRFHPGGINVSESHQSSAGLLAEPRLGGALSRLRAAHSPARTAPLGLSLSAQPLSGLTGDRCALNILKVLEPASSETSQCQPSPVPLHTGALGAALHPLGQRGIWAETRANGLQAEPRG